jgi:hypothetical protein
MNQVEIIIESIQQSGKRVPLMLRFCNWAMNKIALSSGVKKSVLDEEIDKEIRERIKAKRRSKRSKS